MSYFSELCAAMEMLAQEPRSIFLGQAVGERGTGMSASFANIPKDRLLELPVFEACQLGMSIGLSLNGDLPISVFPRWNFLLSAADQLVNHLDAIPRYSGYRPHVIIRTASATDSPLDPGPQHLGDFSEAFRLMFRTVEIVQLHRASDIVPMYEWAMKTDRSSILVEYPGLYDD